MRACFFLICSFVIFLSVNVNAETVVNKAYRTADTISNIVGSRQGMGWNDKRLISKYYKQIQQITNKYEVDTRGPWCEPNSRDPRCNPSYPNPRVPRDDHRGRNGGVVNRHCYNEIRKARPLWPESEVNYLCSSAPRDCVYQVLFYRPNWFANEVVSVCNNMNHGCVVNILKFRQTATVYDIQRECSLYRH